MAKHNRRLLTVCVTGGRGFIGKHLVNELVKDGHDVRVLDRPDDITDEEIVAAYMRGCDVVVHLAAVKSVTDVDHMHYVNVHGSRLLLHYAQRNKVPRFVCASSIDGVVDSSPDEYGRTKLVMESMCDEFKGSACSLRLSNVYGPGMKHHGFVADAIDAIANNKRLTIHGTAGTVRDYVYVADVADAFIKAMHSQVTGTLDIGGGSEYSELELVNMLASIAGQELPELRFEHLKISTKSLVELSNEKAFSMLNWMPKHDLKAGLSETWSQYKEWGF